MNPFSVIPFSSIRYDVYSGSYDTFSSFFFSLEENFQELENEKKKGKSIIRLEYQLGTACGNGKWHLVA